MNLETQSLEQFFFHTDNFASSKLPMPRISENLLHVDRDHVFVLGANVDRNESDQMQIRLLQSYLGFLLNLEIGVHQKYREEESLV